ncbi:hypothetical protein OSB04_016292 [Centaurea solstitialis]|uniref:F-box associated beta-propeller type 1 domain-containing protein n=1 Tax=Centaurea solstitialis TaxID=347529 RepID=A0AA38W8B9_9ASTR|nr:hypothetical protein OSB04_016292 [Centaurea solstitialis]
MVPIFKNSIISQMGSVNGLICLWECKHDNTYICNPVTREVITIPTNPQYHKHGILITGYGFGVSSSTGEYKVVRTFQRERPFNRNEYKFATKAEVYTLGTRQWRSVGRVPYWLQSEVAAVLNDHCHWIVFYYEDAFARICSFDLNKETFQLFPSPPIQEIGNCYQSLAVLKGCLCVSDGDDSQFTIWVMKEYGIEKSWYKEVVITRETLNSTYLCEGLKDGTIFFMSGGLCLCAFYPRSDRVEEIHMFGSSKRGLAYRPSFLKLQNFESERVHIREFGSFESTVMPRPCPSYPHY